MSKTKKPKVYVSTDVAYHYYNQFLNHSINRIELTKGPDVAANNIRDNFKINYLDKYGDVEETYVCYYPFVDNPLDHSFMKGVQLELNVRGIEDIHVGNKHYQVNKKVVSFDLKFRKKSYYGHMIWTPIRPQFLAKLEKEEEKEADVNRERKKEGKKPLPSRVRHPMMNVFSHNRDYETYQPFGKDHFKFRPK